MESKPGVNVHNNELLGFQQETEKRKGKKFEPSVLINMNVFRYIYSVNIFDGFSTGKKKKKKILL